MNEIVRWLLKMEHVAVARHESDREDLMAEALAMSPRIELQSTRDVEPVVAGCRANGGWSLYFGTDPVYHFDADARLRRAYCGGKLMRSQGTTLAELTRKRFDQNVRLQRHDLTQTELASFLQVLVQRIRLLSDVLAAGGVQILRCVSDVEASVVLDDLQRFLQRVLSDGPSLSPPIPGKR